MVTDMVKSLRFYHEVLGAPIAFTVDGDQNTEMPGEISDKVMFASIMIGNGELMLQAQASLIQDSPVFDESTVIGASATFYVRVDDVDAVASPLAFPPTPQLSSRSKQRGMANERSGSAIPTAMC